jgi:SpoVK/Ycf46/Vps4 family AAA+-type ATPase
MSDGLSNAFARSAEVFKRIGEAEHVIVLFDEIEELVRNRDVHLGSEDDFRPSLENRLLTSNMLTLLQELKRRGRGIYIVATNYFSEFDEAVRQPSRFDMILKVLPPNVDEKFREFIRLLTNEENAVSEIDATSARDNVYGHSEEVKNFTYREWTSLVDRVVRKHRAGSPIPDAFESALGEFKNPLLNSELLSEYGDSQVF